MDIRLQLVAQFPAVPEYARDLAMTHNNLGLLLGGLSKWNEARAEYLEARDILQKLAAQFPAVPEYQQQLAATHINLGNLLRARQTDEARNEYEQARDIEQKLAAVPRRCRLPAVPGLPTITWEMFCTTDSAMGRKQWRSTSRRGISNRSWQTSSPPCSTTRRIWLSRAPTWRTSSTIWAGERKPVSSTHKR